MEWIDDKKAYDIVPQSLIIDSLRRYQKADKVIKFIEETMKNWRVELAAGVENPEVYFKEIRHHHYY